MAALPVTDLKFTEVTKAWSEGSCRYGDREYNFYVYKPTHNTDRVMLATDGRWIQADQPHPLRGKVMEALRAERKVRKRRGDREV